METARQQTLLRWIGLLACAGWLIFWINREILQTDASKLGFRAPEVVAQMKNCTGDEARQRYECTEQAILAGQHRELLGAAQVALVVFGPPVLLGFLGWRLLRDRSDQPPPPIKRWRVR